MNHECRTRIYPAILTHAENLLLSNYNELMCCKERRD